MSKVVNIDIDKAIKFYNDNDDNIEKLTRDKLFKQMDNSLNKMTLSNWKNGKYPAAFNVVYEVSAITGCAVDNIITVEDGDS